ncbi:hypothetical protein MSG28_001997 [Choristoneura fumiferana]|uniref:Uncharacterized protein n=1 Tax=Choristoneura fumiferana TaxID=7141 RepID=A0ACC0JTK4_CHOFU|nr:hypothetical protein MSG28_001997 [Choristoneura fumiferana]
MGQSPSSMRSKSGRQRSFRGFARRSKLNKSSLSHTFSLPPSEEYPELMNVNTATEEQLMTLPGVNRQLARAIVLHRQLIDRFKRVDDLALVSGIGAEKLELLRPEISINNRKQISRASSCSQSLDSIRVSIESKLCSVNSSSVFQLQCVPGLNQEIAANIVDHRNKKGPFKSLDDLIKVRGMDVVRLSTVKQHLSLELRKCESVQHLTNGHVNGWAEDTINKSLVNSTSTPRTPHRKSLSMPTKLPMILPNGFAAAPVNDILDLLSAYSHRPIVEEEFTYERDGVRCCRLASWNLHRLNIDKVTNPGVREVLDSAALKILCDELNSPSLRRVKEWKANSHKWEYCIAEQVDSQKLGFLFDSSNKGITIEDIALDLMIRPLVDELASLRSERLLAVAQATVCPLTTCPGSKGRSRRPPGPKCGSRSPGTSCPGTMCRRPLPTDDVSRVEGAVKTAARAKVRLALAGDFLSWNNVQSLECCEPLLDEGLSTTIDNTYSGQTCILCPGTIEQSNFNGHSGAIKSGLSHLAIPRGWSWGGPASPFCPIWAEIKVQD